MGADPSDRSPLHARGRPVTRPNNHAWKKALRRAKITNLRWHDLRHTFASWHAQAGTPMHVLQELGGWAEHSMVRRCAHFSPGHLARYADAPVGGLALPAPPERAGNEQRVAHEELVPVAQ